MDAVEALRILVQVADALEAAHTAGLIHRDLKPENVLLEEAPSGARAYLTDFGLAKATLGGETTLTATGDVFGTINYMAPEMIQGHDIDGRADVYALGCMLYLATTGIVPYPAKTDPAKLLAHVNAPVPLPTEQNARLPAAIDTLVMAMLSKDPAHRPRDAAEAIRWALGEVGAGPEIALEADSESRGDPTITSVDPARETGTTWLPSAREPAIGSASPPKPIGRRFLVPVIAAAAVLLAGGTVAAVAILDRSPEPQAIVDGEPTDSDSDGTPDESDLCPDETGPASNNGCKPWGRAPPVQKQT
jgi:serine/threonine protein kinase